MSEVTMDRERWGAGTHLLLSVLEDDLAIAKAIRAGKFYELHAAALLARRDVAPEMAMTDPARYTALRQAITIFFLKGYRCLDIEKLEQSSRSGSTSLAAQITPMEATAGRVATGTSSRSSVGPRHTDAL